MTISVRNLAWLRSIKGDTLPPDFGSRMHEIVTDITRSVGTIEQQGNFDASGRPAPPPTPDALHVVPHPQGVQFSITHNADFYQGAKYEIDVKSGLVTHTYDVGTARNGILPVGALTANYQVRTRYPNGASSAPVQFASQVAGGTGSTALLPSQGAGTTRPSQPPGFGPQYRGTNPPQRGKS